MYHPNLSKRQSIIAIALCSVAVTGIVSASVLSNYLLPSTVRITSQPGIAVFLGDSSTNTCTTQPVTSFDWGDVQATQSKSGLVVCIENSGGNAAAYLVDAFTTGGTHISSLDSQGLPVGVHLSW